MSSAPDPLAIAERACARIAPVWPLDRFIAVNPFWGHIDKPFPRVAGELASLSGARLLMPRAWYAEEWRKGRLKPEHLRAAIRESGVEVGEEQLTALFWIDDKVPPRRPLVVDVMDARCHRELELSWRDFIVARLSRYCASYFDDGQAQVHPARDGLYTSWRDQAMGDQSISVFMGLREYRAAATLLPPTAEELLRSAWAELDVPHEQRERYLTALLLDINGWASWCAYLRWTARLAGGDDASILELLAIRVGWEWILHHAGGDELRADWRHALASWPVIDRTAESAREHDWILQRAAELAWTQKVCDRLPQGFGAARATSPKLQAVFCLDVRSEVFRRALEGQGKGVETLGAAGFFGLPIEYAPLGADGARPQLPGLLAPRFRVTDVGAPAGLEGKRRSRLHAAQAWKAFRSNPLSSFAFVDTIGLLFAADILGESFGRGARSAAAHESAGLSREEHAARTPRITSRVDGTPITLEERRDLAEGMLRAMSLTRGFAPTVLLVGHGAAVRNNPGAAGLDCGACCGQTGEINARAAAALLNDPEIRVALATRGIEIPTATRFVPALHNTTTDDVALFDAPPDASELADLLARASAAARRERAPKLGLEALGDAELHAAVRERARNWAEVRPEWGLADNASLIVAPRERTRHVDLKGRAFLLDYRAAEDPDFAILELIMTAPMVVAHWINFQYYASTVDNRRYGSGNKVLHNVVGGHLGVYEGNGGDLRVGLSIQSLHDGERWMHAPLRLGVFIEAPADAIDRVLERHAKVRDLVVNEWLHLFQIDAAGGAIRARGKTSWTSVG